MDVLEHLDDDAVALCELTRLVRPGGLIIITVPALQWLWSDWDVVLHHRRRYYKADVRRLVAQPDLQIVHLAYTNCFALPLVLMVRLWRKAFPSKPGSESPRTRCRVDRLIQSYMPHMCIQHVGAGRFR